jgi:hypothetical protein
VVPGREVGAGGDEQLNNVDVTIACS